MRLGRFILAYHVLAPDMPSLILTTILGGGRHDSHFTDEEIGHRVLSYLFHVSQKVGGIRGLCYMEVCRAAAEGGPQGCRPCRETHADQRSLPRVLRPGL